MKLLHMTLVTSLLFSISAHANLITLQGYSPSSTRLGGTLTFTYDDTVLDSVQDEYLDGPLPSNQVTQYGVYQNAITSASFTSTTGTTNGKVFTLVPNSSNTIQIWRRTGHSKIIVDMSLSDGELTDIFHTYNTFGTTPSDGLSTLLQPIDFVDDHYWIFLGDMQDFYGGPGPFTVVSSVPIPTAAWLFGSSLLGLARLSRKRK